MPEIYCPLCPDWRPSENIPIKDFSSHIFEYHAVRKMGRLVCPCCKCGFFGILVRQAHVRDHLQEIIAALHAQALGIDPKKSPEDDN